MLLLGLIACGRNADEAKTARHGDRYGFGRDHTHIIMTYQTKDSSRTEQLDAVMEAVNADPREEIGVEVELLPGGCRAIQRFVSFVADTGSPDRSNGAQL